MRLLVRSALLAASAAVLVAAAASDASAAAEDGGTKVVAAPAQTFDLPPGVPAEYNRISSGYKGTTTSDSSSAADVQSRAHGTGSNATDVSIALSLPSNNNEDPSPVGRSPEEGMSSNNANANQQPAASNSTGVSILPSLPSAEEQTARQAVETCADVLTATFFDANEEKRDCRWLADQLDRDYDRANLQYCGMLGAQPLVGYRQPLAAVLCPATCGLSCTYASDTCRDSSALIGIPSVLKKKKKCGWIKKSAKRIARYCSAEEGVRTRGDAACPRTCGKCGQLSASVMTEGPSSAPSAVPTVSARPSSNPTGAPVTSAPSDKPSVMASDVPSLMPTASASATPTLSHSPSSSPSDMPSAKPSASPTKMPSDTPSVHPSVNPSALPSESPSKSPSSSPSNEPSGMPSQRPSHTPTVQPTAKPTRTPTSRPTYDLDQRAQVRLAECGNAKIATYDFENLPTITATCNVCVSSDECADNGKGVSCCKYTFAQLCMEAGRYWSEKQIEQRCL